MAGISAVVAGVFIAGYVNVATGPALPFLVEMAALEYWDETDVFRDLIKLKVAAAMRDAGKLPSNMRETNGEDS
jgi:hypothetical protein